MTATGQDRQPPARGGAAPVVTARIRRLLAGTALLGVVVFVYGAMLGDATRAWQALLVNFLFFAGLAQSGVVLSALLQVTTAGWARPFKRTTEATAAFLPVAFVLLIVLLLGLSAWAPWVIEPHAHRDAWLTVPAMFTRQLAAFVLLGGLSVAYLYFSLRPDIGMLDESGARTADRLPRRLISGWRGTAAEQEAGQRRQNQLAPFILLAYGWVYSLVAFDFVVALDPHWYSSLAGGYFFTGNLLIGVAFLTLVAVWGRHRLGLQAYVDPARLRDLGTLLFGFCILWAYMLWSQYVVIWYGDLPEETGFVSRRMSGMWASPTWSAFALAFVVPFVVLLSRKAKMSLMALGMVASAVLLGMWIERFVLVSPSLWVAGTLPLGLSELAITAGMLSLFLLCYTQFLYTFPILAVSDPRLRGNG